MIEKNIKIKNKLGLHARPAALLAQTVAKFQSKVSIVKNGQEVDGDSILGIMMLAAEFGSQIRVIVDGKDEKEAIEKIEELFTKKFEEE
ncbi:HPr family phosphocarrier protein [bacterium]|nr:HPr family phosphocarrier protein [bacterium]NIN92994.1 HPr family phosphocarrier protein [bacterium]NIO19058.1 HPr family phosphocarrier protein [bacterium]NIO74186.1 HPr family phosphocarrier protein [bacterium]